MKKRTWVLIIVVAIAISVLSATVTGARIQVQEQEQPQIKVGEASAYMYGNYFIATVPLSEAGTKALQGQVGDLATWIEGVVYGRAEDAVHETVIRILMDDADFYLTKAQKDAWAGEMTKRGIYLVTYESIPDDLKAELIKLVDQNKL